MAANSPFDGVTNLLQAIAAQDQIAGQLQTITDQLVELKAAGDNANRVNTTVPAARTLNSDSGNSAILDAIGGVLGGGLGLIPLISGFTSLFGGDNSPNNLNANLSRFSLPAAIRADAGISQGIDGGVAIDNAQGGLPRAITQESSSPQITVNITAMDSKSFLDHSDDIAKAVRQAMLESTVLNDVIREV
jgi:hypothetical protein